MEIGAEIPSSVNNVTFIDMLMYAGATWNYFLLHTSKEFAQQQGFTDANIAGPHYGAFLAKMMTNWIGDRGKLRRLAYQVRVMGFPGDTLICKGRVIKKYQEADDNLIDCDIWVENQHGETVAPASATVSLPSGEI